MLRDTLRSELSRERAELRKEINGALKGVTARMDAIEKGLEHHGSRTLQGVETLSTAQAEHGVKLQAVAADTATLGQRIAALEKKVRDIQSVGSTPAANDSGRTPALIMGGWPPDTLAADVLDKANAMARYFKLEIKHERRIRAWSQTGFALIPLKPNHDETEEDMRQPAQACIRRVRLAGVDLGTKPDGNRAKLWLAVSQASPKKAAGAGFSR